MTANESTPSTGKEASGTDYELQTDGGTAADGRTDGGPTPEVYKQRALDGAADRILEEIEHVESRLRRLETRLRDGEDPTPDDLLMVQRVLNGSAESIIDSLDLLVVDDEPEIVAQLRELQLGSSGSLLHAASVLKDGRRLSPGFHRFGRADLAWAFAVYDLLEEYGAVAPKGETGGEVDVNELAAVIEAVEEADDVVVVQQQEESEIEDEDAEEDNADR